MSVLTAQTGLLKLAFSPTVSQISKRNLFGLLISIANRFDQSRVDAVGADRACAEWLLRTGASVKWKGAGQSLKDYNSLPPPDKRLHIEEIDATESSVMGVGFPHLQGVHHLKKMILHNCVYLDDDALLNLDHVKESLEHLQLTSCGTVTDEGVNHLTRLGNLKHLHLQDLQGVDRKKECLKILKSAIPECEIKFPDAEREKT